MPELLVNHVVVVIAKPQLHGCESRSVLYPGGGRDVLLFVGRGVET